MRILRLYTRLPPLIGGMENHISQLTKEQIKLGHEVVIYFNSGQKVSEVDVKVSNNFLSKTRPQFIGILIFYFLEIRYFNDWFGRVATFYIILY